MDGTKTKTKTTTMTTKEKKKKKTTTMILVERILLLGWFLRLHGAESKQLRTALQEQHQQVQE